MKSTNTRIQENINVLHTSVNVNMHLYLPFIEMVANEYTSGEISSQSAAGRIRSLLPSMEEDVSLCDVFFTREIVKFIEEDIL